MHIPIAALLTEGNGLENLRGDGITTQLIFTAK